MARFGNIEMVGGGKLIFVTDKFKQLGTFNPAMVFDSNGEYSDITLTENITISATKTQAGINRMIEITTDGSYTITLGSGVAEILGGDVLSNTITPPAGTYSVYMIGTSKGVKINIPALETTGVSPSIFTGITKVSDTVYDVTVSAGLYGSGDGSTAANAADFVSTLTQGANGTATSASISSVTKSPSGALTGGETTFRFTVTYTGTPNGYEQIKFGAAGPGTLFYVGGSAVDASYETANIYINSQTYSAFNGTTNYAWAGDILDSLIEADNATFSFEFQVSGWTGNTVRLVSKSSTNNGIHLFYSSGSGAFNFLFGDGTNKRVVISSALGVVSNGDVIRLEYDGSIDTNSGIDRVVFKKNGVVITNSSVGAPIGTFPHGVVDTGNNSLALGDLVTGAGVNGGAAMFNASMKSFKLFNSNTGGDTVINIPTISVGLDVSGNSNDFTWEI